MSLFRLLLFASFALTLCFNSSKATESPLSDPYEHVHSIKLKNGLKAVLAPSADAKTFQIKVKVHGGIYNEEPGKAGVAHLLEHYLFTDAKLEKNMTYLEAIKEKGGSGNATTEPKETNYFATVPANLAPWIVGIMGKILFEKTFDEERVQHAKGPVFLEIGRPNLFDYVSLAVQSSWPDYARPQDFWSTEFGIREPMVLYSAPRLQTEWLKSNDLKRFYDHVYFPSNITVFVAGNFTESEMLLLLEKTFGSDANRKGEGWVDPLPQVRKGIYIQSRVTSGVPVIEVGTKVAGISLEDETVIRMYLDYLSHRLMKDLRNVRGETYTVRPDIQLKKRSGLSGVKFETPKEDYRQNLNFVKDTIDRETRRDQFTKEMFKEAHDLYAKGFARIDRDSGTMMSLASRVDYIETQYSMQSNHANDYQTFQSLSYDEFVRRLSTLFAPDMRVEELTEPPLLFRFESVVLWIFAFAFWMRITRRLFAKKFAHSQIRWVRKVSYPPAYILQLAAFSMIGLATALTEGAINLIWDKIDILQRSFLTAEYLANVLWFGLVLMVSQCVLGMFARKVMVVGDFFWIKSLGYRSTTFKLAEVEAVEVRSPLSILFSLKSLMKVKHRYSYYDVCFWRKGILVHLKSGVSYFVGVTSAYDAASELHSFLAPTLTKAEVSQIQKEPEPVQVA